MPRSCARLDSLPATPYTSRAPRSVARSSWLAAHRTEPDRRERSAAVPEPTRAPQLSAPSARIHQRVSEGARIRVQETSPMAQSLYQKYGGKPAVSSVVDDFYARVLGDPALAHYFEGVDMKRLRAHQICFVCKALGGPELYAGRDMAEAHRDLGIDDASFDRVAGHLGNALDAAGFVAEDRDAVLELVGSLRDEVVFPKAE